MKPIEIIDIEHCTTEWSGDVFYCRERLTQWWFLQFGIHRYEMTVDSYYMKIKNDISFHYTKYDNGWTIAAWSSVDKYHIAVYAPGAI